ncbi:MAG: hypothetical protein CL760_02790 [Chloroflexi bacterium]|nr:hypothetical protein [Chloroflexota bacterium]MCH2308709.1 hypothetical protein [SAR202 cluster bacterium]MQG05059.1 hypothetical protein [SAR202 cluster bacterium]|tara:strand:- start:1839 stop:2162 length:324 start_codon:yes stop_codon:yes gene_type:complete
MPRKGKKVASKQNSLKKKKRDSKPTIQQFRHPNATSNETDENQIDTADTTYSSQVPVTEPKKIVKKNSGNSTSPEPLRYPYLSKEILQVGIVSSIIIIILGITYTIV